MIKSENLNTLKYNLQTHQKRLTNIFLYIFLLFKQIFGHTPIELANKLINRKDKEENQIIVNNIRENKEKLYKQDDHYNL